MRRTALVCLTLLVAACGGGGQTQGLAQQPADAVAPDEALIDEVYAGLSEKDRVSQLLMPSVDTLSPADARATVRATRPGGLIIMAPGSAAQWRPVVRAAQAEAARLGLPPLLIGADQENGSMVRRMRMPVTIPGAMTLGAAVAGDQIRGLGVASGSGALTGQWLRAAGVNIDFAPVADVNSNPNNPVIGIRSPGGKPSVVSDAVVGQVGGFDDANVLSTAKHFPGHGDTGTDSHLGLAKVTHSKKQMARIDLPPFEAAIKANVPAIMIAHVTVPAYDKKPASVSRKMVTGLLRKKMGYDGLVVSDSLGMGAVAQRSRLYVDVVRAGIDVLLMPNSPSTAARQVRAAMSKGSLGAGRVEEAVRHVLAAKDRLGLLDAEPGFVPAPGRAESRQAAREIASAGTTVLGSCRVLVRKGATVIGYGPAAEGVRSGLRSAGVGSGPVRVVVQSTPPGGADVWVATGSPYPALRASTKQRVLTYGDITASGWAAGRAIAGRIELLGGLPVRGPEPCEQLR